MVFAPLDDSSTPEQGLFFVERHGYPGQRCSNATGMGFLVDGEGLVVTASHVLLTMQLIPGITVKLYTDTSGGPIAVEAEILAEGWRGPAWQDWITKADALAIPDIDDIRPTDYFEDTAVLRLMPETAQAVRKRQPLTPVDAARLLQEDCRVLPLASPGFTGGARLKAWHAFWDGSDLHQLRAADVQYRCVEPGLQHSIRLHDELDYLKGGYSGSPLWDDARKRVVGMVRRGIKTSVPDAVLGIDARRIATAARVALVPDPAAGGVLAALRGAAEQLAPMRHFPILRAMLPDRLLDLRVCVPKPRHPLAGDEADPGRPGIAELRAALAREPIVLVAGGGGSGKTTLLVALAQDLLADPLEVGGQRLVPLYLQAADFHRTGFDLDGVLRDHVLRHTPAAAPGHELRQVLRDNDLSLVLMIDGLDELPPIERAKLTGRFRRGAELAGLRTLLTARPTEELVLAEDGRSQEGWLVLEVAALDRQEIGTLASILFDDADEAEKFGKMLSEIRWDRQAPTPLQVVASASLLKSNVEWRRAVDLPFQLADHLLLLGIREDNERRGRRPRPGTDAVYVLNIEAILGHVAQLSLDRAPDEERIVRSLDEVSTDWANDPEGLLRFLKAEVVLLGGLIAWTPGIDAALELRWPHRTVAEALAARAVAKRVRGDPAAGRKAVLEVLRNTGQSSAMLMLAAMDDPPNPAVDLSLQQALAQGSANFKMVLFAIRALGAGIRTSAELRKRLVATLIALLLLPESAQKGPLMCADLFSVEELPNPIDIARRKEIREAIIEQLNERFRRRAASLRRSGEDRPVLRLTRREAQLLDRLGMWSDMAIHGLPPDHTEVGQAVPNALYRPVRGAPDPRESILATGLLGFAIQQLQDDADGFLAGFAAFAMQLGPDADLSQAGRVYVGELLKKHRGR